jgi:hypothetical protein
MSTSPHGLGRRRANASRTSGSKEIANPLPGAEPFIIDYGVPTFALCGEVALVAGPTILGVPAVRKGWNGQAVIRGGLRLEMLETKFNAEGRVDACLEFVDVCRGGKGVVSDTGIAVCLKISYAVDDWRPGIGYRWGDSLRTLYFAGCSLGPYKTQVQASAAQAGERTVTFKEGLPGAAIAVEGTDAPPGGSRWSGPRASGSRRPAISRPSSKRRSSS